MSQKIRAILVDDFAGIHQGMRDMCMNSHLLEITESFTCPLKFLEAEPNLDYDLLLLDIMMPAMDGFEVAKRVKKPIVFITFADDKLKEALALSPIDVLTKPFSFERFLSAAEKAKIYIDAKRSSNAEYKILKSSQPKGKVKIKLADIIYIKGSTDNYRHKQIVMKDGEQYTLSHSTFDELLSLCRQLVQVNKIELVSLDAIRNCEYDQVTLKWFMVNGKNKQVSINRAYREEFFKRLEKSNPPLTAF